MPNMSYCRFENTSRDLIDCEEALDDNEKLDKEYELPSAIKLIHACKRIAEKFEGMSDEEIKAELEDSADECPECGYSSEECECEE